MEGSHGVASDGVTSVVMVVTLQWQEKQQLFIACHMPSPKRSAFSPIIRFMEINEPQKH